MPTQALPNVEKAQYVPMELFGKDHWSLLLYIEDCVTNKGFKPAHDPPNATRAGLVALGNPQNSLREAGVLRPDAVGYGEVQHNRMRANETTHPLLKAVPGKWSDGHYGTRLIHYFGASAEGLTPEEIRADQTRYLPDHDDWDCLDDLEAAGLAEAVSLINGVVGITELGLKVAHQIREHQARGGYCSNFTPAL